MRIPDIFVYGNWVAITIAIAFMSIYARRITQEMTSMNDAVTATQLALSRTQMLNDLGGVIAAAAHELGTPLATIKLTSAELMEELDDNPELASDAKLIREQADRCRDILRSMGRAGKDDLQIRNAPLMEMIRESAEPHMDRGKNVILETTAGFDGSLPQPTVIRRPEVIHGLRNLVQNAVDFSKENVWIEALWTDDILSVRIIDDGPGYPPSMIGRIGDPFVRKSKSVAASSDRPGYDGMGLGLFIAKTLLERSGAELSFANASNLIEPASHDTERRGAVVEVVWPLSAVVAPKVPKGQGIGENRPFEA